MISLEKISLRAGNFEIRELSLEISAGEYFVLLGPNGSGKTTLVSAICGMIRIDAGRIILNGRDVTELEPRSRRIGYVPQDYLLFPHLNVEENIIFTSRSRGVARKDALLSSAEIISSLDLDRILKRFPYNLSGGERQKVALARALAARPDILILDEPLSSLDHARRLEMSQNLSSINESYGLTTIHICHSLDEAEKLADSAALLVDGKIRAQGSLKTIKEKMME